MATLAFQADWTEAAYLSVITEAFRERWSAGTNATKTSPPAVSAGDDVHRATGALTANVLDWKYLQVLLETICTGFADSYNYPSGFAGETAVTMYTAASFRNALIDVTSNGGTPDAGAGTCFTRKYGSDPDNLTTGYGYIQADDVITEQMIYEICEGLKLLKWTNPTALCTWTFEDADRYDYTAGTGWTYDEYDDMIAYIKTLGGVHSAFPGIFAVWVYTWRSGDAVFAQSKSQEARLQASIGYAVSISGATCEVDFYHICTLSYGGADIIFDDQGVSCIGSKDVFSRVATGLSFSTTMTSDMIGYTTCAVNWPSCPSDGQEIAMGFAGRSPPTDYSACVVNWTFKHT